jgi:hypothetical protein
MPIRKHRCAGPEKHGPTVSGFSEIAKIGIFSIGYKHSEAVAPNCTIM